MIHVDAQTASNCAWAELFVLMICSFSIHFHRSFHDRMPRNQADIGTPLRASTLVVVEKKLSDLKDLKLEFKLISAVYFVLSLLRR